MIERLEKLVDDITSLNSKLVLLVGPPRSGKSVLLTELSERRDSPVLNVGAALGRQLLAVPSTRRHLDVAVLMKDLTDETARQGMLLLDNIELLFDRTLRLDPLTLLKGHARARRVIAVWPGELRECRLSYAAKGHPEHQDYGIDGLVPFEIH
ncbi:MAG: BREX-3 system P-loop-containing protein BrxF [Rhodospirillaceae bacterium]|nr:BREX-3 system P-loop-containing protein BrxF [Rhodospirillaceae bacterium]